MLKAAKVHKFINPLMTTLNVEKRQQQGEVDYRTENKRESNQGEMVSKLGQIIKIIKRTIR